jgi:hypothetical protein
VKLGSLGKHMEKVTLGGRPTTTRVQQAWKNEAVVMSIMAVGRPGRGRNTSHQTCLTRTWLFAKGKCSGWERRYFETSVILIVGILNLFCAAYAMKNGIRDHALPDISVSI